MSLYEKHVYEKEEFPIIFHFDDRNLQVDDVPIHWHENIELLYFVKGKAEIVLNDKHVYANKGDIVVINSQFLHWIRRIGDEVSYYCLIPNKSLTDAFSFMTPDTLFSSVISNQAIMQYFNILIQEMLEKNSGYQQAVKLILELIFLELTRHYVIEDRAGVNTDSGNQKIEMVKSAVRYIRANYKENISLADVSSYLGFSSCYFCHVFKEITGQTVLEYINYLRCAQAKKMILSGLYNISESAAKCGFHNLSYFSKTYKKIFGNLPSQEKWIRIKD